MNLLIETLHRLPLVRRCVLVARTTEPHRRGEVLEGHRVVSCRPAGIWTYRVLVRRGAA